MPAFIFGNDPGLAGAYAVPGLPANLMVQGWNSLNGVPKIFKTALTGYSFGGTGGYQFLHTLRDVIYIYVFGERIGQLQLTGVAFMGLCSQPQDTSGLDDLYNFYNENRLSVSGIPVNVTFGIQTSVQAFLIGFNLGIVDSQSGLAQFTLMMTYPPQKVSTGATSGADDETSPPSSPFEVPTPAQDETPPFTGFIYGEDGLPAAFPEP